jgi:modulator of FtsH protease
MNQQFEAYRFGGISSIERNKVLRNTYFLLALSLVPTILGTWLGVAIPALGAMFRGGLGALLFMGIAFGFFYGIERTKHSSAGVYMLLGFTFFMGIALSGLIRYALGVANGAQMIMLAGGGTSLIFFGLASYATVSKKDFTNMGKALFIGAVMLMVASIANIFLAIPALHLTICVIALGLFSAFLLYDLSRIINGGETNYISATLSLYLSIYNIFTSLLQLLLAFGGGSSKD